MKRLIIVVIAITLIGIGFICYFAFKCYHKNTTLITDTATCLSGGERTYKCDNCDKIIVVPSNQSGHRFGEPILNTATCTEDGEMTAKCSVCGYLQVFPSPRTGHDYEGIYCKTCGSLREDCFGGEKVDFSSGTYNIDGREWQYTINSSLEVLGSATPTVTFIKDSNNCRLNLMVKIDKELSAEHNLQVTAIIYDKANNQLGYGSMSSYIKYKGSYEDYAKSIMGADIELSREISEGEEIYVWFLKNDSRGRS